MNKESRTKNSLINMIVSLSSNAVSIIIGFIAQAVFIKTLGNEYLGLNGVFSNVISMLCIVELGIGSAIIYNLYKPIANSDYETIKSLMRFYKKSYHIIGIIVLIIGILIIPFINYIIGNVTVNTNIYIAYLLFLSDAVLSYFLSYKRSILYANQKNYYIQIIHIAYLLVLNILQIIFLIVTKNYYIYLVIKVSMRLIENIIISAIANRLYPFLLEKNVKILDKVIQLDIFKKIKALILHQISSFIISGTDNLIITKYLGLVQVGLYSNYNLIIKSVQTLTQQIIEATAPSVGNLLVTESVEKQFEVFKKMRFINFWIASFCGICLFEIMEPFITIWIGDKYLLSNVVLLILVINFYQKNMRNTYLTFKTTAGIFYEDRFVPIIESVLNIIISIFLVKRIGLAGVFVGTVVSGLVLWLYTYPICIYKKLFKRRYIDYLKETIGYIVLFIGLLLFTNFICNSIIIINNTVLLFCVRLIICLTVPNMLLTLVFCRTDKFCYIKMMLRKILRKILRIIGEKNMFNRFKTKNIEYYRKIGVKIGKNTDIIKCDIDIGHGYLVSIGNNCTLTNCVILAHDASTKKTLGKSKIGHVIIGNNVFIGYKSIVLPNVEIGDNCVIGAGSVVTNNIPANSIAVGNPCRVIGTYDKFIEKNKEYMKSKPVFDTYWKQKTDAEKLNEIKLLKKDFGYDE